MNATSRPLLLVGALLVAGLAAALVLPGEGLSGLVDLRGHRFSPPPELRVATPAEGEGVGPTVRLTGEAISVTGEVIDVQVRVDGGRWTSVDDAPRGQRAVPFVHTIPLPPGDHLIETRAWDGETFSLTERALVRRDAPTVWIDAPAQGASLEAGPVEVRGRVVGASHVLVSVGDDTAQVSVGVSGAWTARIELAPGHHELRAVGIGDNTASLPARVRVAAGSPPPPSLTMLTPREGAAFGDAGDPTCPGGCILVSGLSEGAARVEVALDGRALAEAELNRGGAWSHRIPLRTLGDGAHDVGATPIAVDGAPGAAQSLRFLARTATQISILGDADAHPTGTPLSFEAAGDGAQSALWALDGEPLGEGRAIELQIARPGDHVVSARVPAPGGGTTSATLPLYAVNRLPQVDFLGEPTLVGARMRIEASATDVDGEIAEYRWDFGDGERVTTREPIALHRYPERGVYALTLVAVDDAGGAVTTGREVIVPNAPPAVSFTWEPAEPTILDVITLRDESFDPDGRIVERFWRLPDGRGTSEVLPTFRASAPGEQSVSLRIVDDVGAVVELSRMLPVANLPPEARFRHEPTLPRAHAEVLFLDLSQDVDTPIVSRRWAFDDGASAEGDAVVHVFRTPGEHLVRLVVTDALGSVANVAMAVHVVDSEPQVSAVLIEPPAPIAHQDVRFEVRAEDRDGSIVGVRWEFGDGTNSTEQTPLHRYPRSGYYHGQVTVIDEGGLAATLPFHLLVENAPPTATLRLASGGIAAYPTLLAADAHDPDGRITYYRFDADGDGLIDCETTEATCTFVYETPGLYAARVQVDDDEAGTAEAHLLVEATTPPASLAPPKVRVENPIEQTTVRGEQLFRGEAAGVRPIVRVDLQVRNATWAFSGAREPWRLVEGGAQWHALVDTRGFPDGPFDLVVRATDEGGGVGFARIPIVIENGPRPSEVSVQLVDSPGIVSDDTEIRASAFHPLGVTSVRWRIDDRPWQAITQNPLAFVIPLDWDTLAPGEHVLRVEAYRGTTESASATHPFRVPGVAPALVVDEPPTSTAYGLLRAGGRIVGEGHVQWRIDTGLWHDIPPGGGWLLAEETADLRNGPHTLDLRAISPDGRLMSPLKSYSVDVVNPSPQAAAPRTEAATTQDVPLAWALAALALAGTARVWRRG